AGRYSDLVTGSYGVRVGEPCIGERIGRIGDDRLLEQVDAFFNALRRAPVPELTAFQIKTISLRICCPCTTQPLFCIAAHPDPHVAGEIPRDVALDLGDVGEFARVVRTPELCAICRIYEVCLYTQ